MTRPTGATGGEGPAEALVGLSPADLRDLITRAHGMATGTYCQSDSEMRARIGAMLDKAIDADPIMRGFLGRGGPRADCDAIRGSGSLS